MFRRASLENAPRARIWEFYVHTENVVDSGCWRRTRSRSIIEINKKAGRRPHQTRSAPARDPPPGSPRRSPPGFPCSPTAQTSPRSRCSAKRALPLGEVFVPGTRLERMIAREEGVQCPRAGCGRWKGRAIDVHQGAMAAFRKAALRMQPFESHATPPPLVSPKVTRQLSSLPDGGN